MKKRMGVLVVTIFVAGMIAFFEIENRTSPTIVINEVCSRNGFVDVDDEHLGEDYIELYNAADYAISLKGWWLSDDVENPQKQCLPDITLEANSYVLFYADGKSDGDFLLDFKISDQGEKIILSDSEGKQVDVVYVPALEMDNVYARVKDGKDSWEIMGATPGESNEKAAPVDKVSLDVPVFSHSSGVYEDGFLLTLSASKGTKIYYTLDGSIPTENSNLYDGPITVTDISKSKNILNAAKKVVADWKDYQPLQEYADKGTVVRAIAADGKGNISEVVTQTYLVGLDKYKDSNVIAISADYEQLLGENGILITGEAYDDWYLTSEMSADGVFETGWTENYELTNYWQRGRSTEVYGNLQYFSGGEEVLNQNIGLRVHGNAARMNAKKNLQLFSRSAYSGNSVFDTQFFDGYDSHGLFVSASLEKVYCLGLAEDRNLGLQSVEKAAVFINGEYWYDAVLMEKFDKHYLEQHYGVNPENVLMIKDTEAAIGEDFYYIYEELIEYLRNTEISNEEKCVTLYEIFDVQSIIDWMCFNLYVCNNDVSYKKNCVYWRTIEPEAGVYGDCKWRWLLYDIDHAATYVSPESVDFKEFSIVSDNRFYWALSTSEHFCRQFVLTAFDMMNTNFSLENVEKVLGEWGLDLSYGDDFFIQRPEYMIQSLRNEFGLTGTVENVTITTNDSEAGKIHINTITPEFVNGTWTGKYITDYPVTVTAEENPGYRFVGWSGASSSVDETIKVDVTSGGVTLTAIFEKE